MVDSFHHDPRPGTATDPASTERARRLKVVGHPPAEEQLEGEEASFEALSGRIALLELQLRELIQIERMRNLELSRLESELEQKSQRLQAVDDALFHERRRSAELERRWNVLAASYEETASRLVEAGSTLAAIQSQRSYRTLVALFRAVGLNRRADSIVARHESDGASAADSSGEPDSGSFVNHR